MRIGPAAAVPSFLLVACLIPGCLADASAGDLSFEERVRAQEAIERVRYSHRIGATRPFEEAVPRAALEEKVRTYLRQSVALETYWKRPITARDLDRELERLARHTRLPGRLGEIRDALGGDGRLLLECLARPALADRLSRSLFAADPRIHSHLGPRSAGGGRAPAGGDGPGITWDAWWARAASLFEPAASSPVAAVPVMAPAAGLLAPGPGTGPVTGPGVAAIAALDCDPGDTWDNGSLTDLADSRVDHAAVWTGTEMIVWGGIDGDGLPRSGGRYDPATDTWTPTSVANAPKGRTGHTAVWTGGEMIVWGGCGVGLDCYFNAGGRYNPFTDTWSPIPTAGAPAGRYLHTAVWTGTEMIVWGGWLNPLPSLANTGGRYNPATDAWAPTSLVNAPAARTRHVALWTGARMIVWGGSGSGGYFNTGARYDPATDSWQATSTAQAPPPGVVAITAVWTGTRMIVWGGTTGPGYRNTGGRYDPIADAWTATSTVNAPTARADHTSVWTGTEMVVWGGRGSTGYLDTGARYNPAIDSWTPAAVANAPAARARHTAVWTGSLMIVWGGHGPVALNAGGRYHPATNSWSAARPTSTTHAPIGRSGHTAVWTGHEMIVWGGHAFDPLNSGGRYDPAIDAWTPTATTHAPEARSQHTAVWTGTEIIVWGGAGLNTGTFGTGGRYDPITDAWMPTSTTNAPAWRLAHSAVWTGTRMIVWGGNGVAGLLSTGGIYDPATDTWTATATAGAPVNLIRQAAVWAGTEMIIWGGMVNNNFPPAGARYDPTADRWTPTSTTSAPSGRYAHTLVWTGTEMIVWGGYLSSALMTGGRYDPARDAWTPTSTSGAPAGRGHHAAVWTGSEMIVWGGWNFMPLATGGRYDPITNAWFAMPTTSAPGGRSAHTAVWTGAGMIVWGGDATGSGSDVATGGLYRPGGAAPAPTADAGPDLVVECAGAAGTVVHLRGAATGCGDLTYTWTGPFPEGGGTVVGSAAAVTVPAGRTTITLTVTDMLGRSATDTVLATAQDTTAPTLALMADPQSLWPPNHDMIPVHVQGTVRDLCDPDPGVVLVAVASSEPDGTPGKGHGGAAGDIAGATPGTPDWDLALRAERDGNGPGRIYTLTYRAVDASGNAAGATAVVTVPHDRGTAPGPFGPREVVDPEGAGRGGATGGVSGRP